MGLKLLTTHPMDVTIMAHFTRDTIHSAAYCVCPSVRLVYRFDTVLYRDGHTETLRRVVGAMYWVGKCPVFDRTDRFWGDMFGLTRSQAVARIADRTASQHLWGHVTSSVM